VPQDRTLDPIYVPLTVTTAAGTTIPTPHGWLEQIDLLIPAGHAGQTGIRFVLNGIALLPYATPSQWIVGDDDHTLFDVPIEIDTGFRVNSFNTGQFPHSHYCRFKVRQLPTSSGFSVTQLAPTDQINRG
jgi:hypothetical protein